MRRKGRPSTEVEVDMTPMIDMTFLLIIFFIIVTDLSQQELEELKLPVARSAVEDKPPEFRPILNVLMDGSIIIKKETYYEPGIDTGGRMDPVRQGKPDYYWKLADFLALKIVPFMNKEVDEVLKMELPDDPILIRADRNTPFKYIQRIMEVCSREGIHIWKVELAAAETPEAKAKRLAEQSR